MVQKSTAKKRRTLLVALATLVMMLTAQHAAAYTYTVLDGTGGTGNEGYPKLVDGDILTKWGHSYKTGSTDAYVIFKSDKAIVPKNYCLVIANDTERFPERNWKSWSIYAANFVSDDVALRDAGGWVLVDKKENEVMPTVNFQAVDYTCSENVTEAYTYFMVVLDATVSTTDVWQQMSEFSWGTSYEFFNHGPINYLVLDGDRNNGDAEGLPKMFDGSSSTKWGNSLTEGTPLFVIFKTTRPVAPSYYCLVTGNDNARWTGRNWRDWKIYGMNADNDSEVTRNSDKWVLIDERENIDNTILPDLNYYEVYFTPNQEVEEAYTYFKIEIYAIQMGSGFMQMSEFFLGDAGSLETDAQKHYDLLSLDLSKPMQKSLAEQYQAKLQAILAAPDIFAVNTLSKECEALQEAVKNSMNAYDDYINIVNQLRNHYENHTCITGEGRTVVGSYLDTEAGPSDTYPNGTYAYIIANGLLDVEGIAAEAVFVNMMMEKYATDLTEGAIDVVYEPFDGVAGFGNENFNNLVDGEDDTKWCSNRGGDEGGYWITFRTSEPIMPTYYRLVTGNDTGNNPDRNWKSWKIYGANFDSDLDCVRESDAWVLIDEKNNIGSDQLPAANYATAFFYLSNPPATPYEYFKIEISNPTGLMQMGEFSFQNGANFILVRQDYYDEFASKGVEDAIACQKYVEEYEATLAKLQTTASIIDLSNLYNTLQSLLAEITTSIERYEDFDYALDEVRYAMSYMDADTRDYWQAYFDDDIEPNDDYPYGSYDYIITNLQIENAEMLIYISYLNDVVRAALEGGFCVLAGNMDTWGEKENYFKLVDQDHSTKWGGNIQQGGSWVIFYTMEPKQPLFYKLVTGNDTQSNPGRNWKDWKVYGGNFEKDADATVDADGWMLLDSREGVGQDRLPAANFYTVPFGFSEGVEDEYKYFMVVVTGAYSGGSIQMSEFEFGTEDELEELRESYIAEIENLSIDGIVATQSLIDTYQAAESAVYDEGDLEDIYKGYITVLNTYNKIQVSATVYDLYQKEVGLKRDALATFEESDELNTLKSYLYDNVEAGDLFPNGSAANVVAKHVLDNEGLLAEIEVMNYLAEAALLKGYKAGADITAMVVNPSFGLGSEGWNGEVYASNYNADYSMSAAEFCNAQSTFHVWQTLTGLKNGYYLVGIKGGCRPANDRASRNYAPMLYANGNVTYIKATIDGMMPYGEAVDHENCWLTGEYPELPILSDESEDADTLGFVLHGVQSCCQAFLAGRYQNYVVAKVTDGTLTFGVKNDGTQNGGDWTGLGNTTIKFLGDDLENDVATAGLDAALDCEALIVEELGLYEGFFDISEYKLKPYVNEAALRTLKANMNSASANNAAKYDAIVSNSACFKEIYAAKNAYVKSIEAMQTVRGKWDGHVILMNDADYSAYDNAVTDVLLGSMGEYSTDEALQAVDDIKAAYPCYIDLDPDKSKGSLEINEVAPFEYELNADGNRPNIGLSRCMYSPLTDEQNILAFEYKCDTALDGGIFYLAHPALSTTDIISYGTLPAASEWKKAYIAIRNDFGWGTSTDHWIRWDLATTGTFDIFVRNAIIITKAQMEAEGGETINDGINPVVVEGDIPADCIYNVMGQRLTTPVKGINIIGGTKVLIK